MWGSFADSTAQSRQLVEELCSTAKKGLCDCYLGKDSYVKSHFAKKTVRLNMALNLRYIIIAQIGIKRWKRHYKHEGSPMPDFWAYIWSKGEEIRCAGDMGLAIWAGVESGSPSCGVFVKKLVKNWEQLRASCNAVELGWVVQALVEYSKLDTVTNEHFDVLKDAQRRLMALSSGESGLFFRHNRNGAVDAVSRQVSCFADQVYPIMALASFGGTYRDSASIHAALAAADAICRLQGEQGQWWWHYDPQKGQVVEEYPVFSVHQHSMAPMALMAVDEAAGTDHGFYIEKGLAWLEGCNELKEKMILHEKGVIWRDIHRREIHKSYRLLRGGLSAIGFHKAHRMTGRNLFGYVVNRECRPYCLGWILYAWAGRLPEIAAATIKNEDTQSLNESIQENY